MELSHWLPTKRLRRGTWPPGWRGRRRDWNGRPRRGSQTCGKQNFLQDLFLRRLSDLRVPGLKIFSDCNRNATSSLAGWVSKPQASVKWRQLCLSLTILPVRSHAGCWRSSWRIANNFLSSNLRASGLCSPRYPNWKQLLDLELIEEATQYRGNC